MTRPHPSCSLAAVVALVALALAATLVACSSDDPEPSVATLPRPSATSPSATTATPPPTTAVTTTTTAATTTTAPVPTPPAPCPSWDGPTVTGRVGRGLRETSGLAASRRTPGVLWAHNDSGNAPVLFAVSETGDVVARVRLDVPALDWEDIAAGPGPDGQPSLWVADVGDNLRIRPRVTLYRLPEPAVSTVDPGAGDDDPTTQAVVERITVRYPDGPHDVEALLVDPRTGDAYLIGKEPNRDDTVPVHRLPAAGLRDGAEVVAEPVGRIKGRASRGVGPTAGDVSADGTLVLVSNGREGFLWRRGPDQDLAAMFARAPDAPCRLDPGGGEAAAFSLDGQHLWAVNEGEGARLRRYDRRD